MSFAFDSLPAAADVAGVVLAASVTVAKPVLLPFPLVLPELVSVHFA
ncbi:hypothetical protein [Methanimicrococcus hacksteinii]|nr:hypothetical protein [Methanimicrococcus sp. At1]